MARPKKTKLPICPMSEEARLIEKNKKKIPSIHECWCCARIREKSPLAVGIKINCTAWVWNGKSEREITT
jgi:hypothetical protein